MGLHSIYPAYSPDGVSAGLEARQAAKEVIAQGARASERNLRIALGGIPDEVTRRARYAFRPLGEFYPAFDPRLAPWATFLTPLRGYHGKLA